MNTLGTLVSFSFYPGIFATYTAANTSGGHTPSQSIFAPATNRQPPASTQVDTADSNKSRGKRATGSKDAAVAAGGDRAPCSDALNPRTRALGIAPLLPAPAAASAEPVAPALRVKFINA